MNDESLIAPKNPDGFTTESPIRAFTNFKVDGLYAIGKGFRPSIGHMGAYLSAMETKEHWQFVQVILPRDNDGEPTMLFRKLDRGIPPMHVIDFGKGFETVEEARRVEETIYDSVSRLMGDNTVRDRVLGVSPALAMPYGKSDDPIHPKHYDGVACCEIIDHMPTNVGLAGKYIWRLGEKDPIAQEIGKLIFYLKRQIEIETNYDDDTPYTSQFGFARPTEAAKYRHMAKDHIYKRFSKAGMPYKVEQRDAMNALVLYTIEGRVDNLQNAISVMESVLFIETGSSAS